MAHQNAGTILRLCTIAHLEILSIFFNFQLIWLQLTIVENVTAGEKGKYGSCVCTEDSCHHLSSYLFKHLKRVGLITPSVSLLQEKPVEKIKKYWPFHWQLASGTSSFISISNGTKPSNPTHRRIHSLTHCPVSECWLCALLFGSLPSMLVSLKLVWKFLCCYALSIPWSFLGIWSSPFSFPLDDIFHQGALFHFCICDGKRLFSFPRRLYKFFQCLKLVEYAFIYSLIFQISIQFYTLSKG